MMNLQIYDVNIQTKLGAIHLVDEGGAKHFPSLGKHGESS